jgi:hypothetical protein
LETQYWTATEHKWVDLGEWTGSMANPITHQIVVTTHAVLVVDGVPEATSACHHYHYAEGELDQRNWPFHVAGSHLWCDECYAELEELRIVPSKY